MAGFLVSVLVRYGNSDFADVHAPRSREHSREINLSHLRAALREPEEAIDRA